MRVGIVAEGRGDLGLLTRILKGAIGVDEEDVQFLRPEFDTDETDTFAMRDSQRSNWGLVLDECRSRTRIRDFFSAQTDERRVLVLHVDAAECEVPGFDVDRSPSADVEALCLRIEKTLRGMMEDEFGDSACFAVAVEESEAWLLALLIEEGDTAAIRDPKRRLERELNQPNRLSDRDRKRLFAKSEYERMRELAKGLSKARSLDEAAMRNVSLRRFVVALRELTLAR